MRCMALLVVCVMAGPAQSQEADRLVAQLRDLPAPMPAGTSRGLRDSEVRRHELYRQLRQLDSKALPALAAGLRSPDVGLRRNVVLALQALGGTWWRLTPQDAPNPMDISPLLPNLMIAMKDQDHFVRAWSTQAIGNIGSAAVSAVPALVVMLANGDEAARNSACIALRGIGPAAKDALPPLRKALRDPSADVRGFAQRAIAAIEGGR